MEKIQVLKELTLGDMVVRYTIDEQRHVGLTLLSDNTSISAYIKKNAKLDSMVQLKLVGDVYPGSYAMGQTMRNSQTVEQLIYKEQSVKSDDEKTEVITVLGDNRNYTVHHHLVWKTGDRFVKVFCEFVNGSKNPATLEMLSSFSIDGISPYLDGDCHGEIMVHRLRSRWSEEGKLVSESMEELKLEPSWAAHGVRCERFGQVGSMPVNGYFPYLVMEDTRNNIFWGAQLAHEASWQMEVYRVDDNIAISGGLADREFGHWKKTIKPHGHFKTPTAILTVCKSEFIEEVSARMTSAVEEAVEKGPKSEQDLPIIFNEYCTTWGCPSHENILAILKAIKGKGIRYFVIDAGWYKQDGLPWDSTMGDYDVSDTLFPIGLEKTVAAIKEAGMIPGLWFEVETVGPKSKAYQMEEHLLHLDGVVLTNQNRRFWNMNDPWVENYLTEKVIGTLKKYGFGYIKIDYNDTIGIGCDGCESLGEGLRRNMEGTMRFIQKIKKEIPEIVIENCASGGHRLEPGFMQACSMASFSDAHECREIPIIAADLHRAILPRQSQIWAVIRKEDSLKRIAYSIINTFLGRMCLSGDVEALTGEQWGIIQEGILFYRSIEEIVKKGQTYIIREGLSSMRHPEGWQCVIRVGENGKALVVIHTFSGELPEKLQIHLPKKFHKIEALFSDTRTNVIVRGDLLFYYPDDRNKAVAVILS